MRVLINARMPPLSLLLFVKVKAVVNQILEKVALEALLWDFGVGGCITSLLSSQVMCSPASFRLPGGRAGTCHKD
jgi:hypothetical protein